MKIGRIIALLIILVFLGYLVYHNVNPAPKVPTDIVVPSSIASGRYPEFLKEALKLEVRVEDKTVWIFLTNSSIDQPIPSEESHRAILCATEIFDGENKLIDAQREFFKRPPLDVPVPTEQIEAKTTKKFGYDLTIPHGRVKVSVIYIDLSVSEQSDDAGRVPIAEQEVKF